MKKQIVSLVLLAAVVIATNTASAQGEDFKSEGKDVREDCTVAQLTDGSCLKDLYANYMIVTNINSPAGTSFTISTSPECGRDMEVVTPQDNRIRLNEQLTLDNAGRYSVVNNGFQMCTIRIMLNK
jgi:predicted small secreted protein